MNSLKVNNIKLNIQYLRPSIVSPIITLIFEIDLVKIVLPVMYNILQMVTITLSIISWCKM